MEYEVVQEHQYQDVYRLKPGVLMLVKKYNVKNSDWYWSYTSKYKNILEKVPDIKNCFKFKKDIKLDRHGREPEVIPAGTILFDDEIVDAITDKHGFYYQIKTTGACFGGDYNKFNELISLAQEIMNKY